VSNLFTIDQGQNAGVRSGMTILLREIFLGVVEQVGTHTARVKLLSDVETAMKVRIGRFTDNGFVPVERYFWLSGRGGGRMEIRDAKRREVEAGLLQLGDTVLSDSTSGALPAAMTIGRITAIQPDRGNPLLAILTVASVVDEESLRRVYVFDPEATRRDGTRPAPQAGK
jgi:cell shape-determining protein MreC